MTEFESVIGLEVHIQLNTNSKAFNADVNAFSQEPNTHVGAVTIALPGTLPYMNADHIKKAVKLGLALDCEINQNCYFDRKNYFYPDLPKGYQITQQNSPICIGGHVQLSDTNIRIHHIHMEEDAGKSIHNMSNKDTYLDYNRAGVPLLELVTEPDFRTADQVYEFINYLRQLVRYIDVSDAVMQEGSLRCDVNLSIRKKGDQSYGTRCEIKNLNSANYAKKAVQQEFKRQVYVVKNGGTVIQQTLDFDFDSGRLTPLRSKEDAHDYRYFPEPDLPGLRLSSGFIENIKNEIDFLPKQLKADLKEAYELSDYDIERLTEIKDLGLHYKDLMESNSDLDPRLLSSFYINKIIPLRRTETNEILDCPLSDNQIVELLHLISDNKISASSAYQQLLPLILNSDNSPKLIAEENNLLQDTDSSEIEDYINEVLQSSPDKLKAYKSGKKGLFGFFMGEVMKKSSGKANPQLLKELLEEKLSS